METLLHEFLNANQISAQQQHQDVGWEYDKYLWKNTSEKITGKEKKLNVKDEMTDASDRKLAEGQLGEDGVE